MNLHRSWAKAKDEEPKKLLIVMLNAVYINAKQSKSIIAIRLSRLITPFPDLVGRTGLEPVTP